MKTSKVKGHYGGPPDGGPLCLAEAVAYMEGLLSPLGPGWQHVEDEPDTPDLNEDEQPDEESIAVAALAERREALSREIEGLREIKGEVELWMSYPDPEGGQSLRLLTIKSATPRTVKVSYRDIYDALASAVGKVVLSNAMEPPA